MCVERKDIEDMVHKAEHAMEERMYKSHNAISKILSENGAQLKKLTDRFNEHDARESADRQELRDHIKQSNEALSRLASFDPDDIRQLKEMAEGYAAFGVMRKVLVGLASSVVALGAIVGAVLSISKLLK
jgi:hypothetical protein